VSTVTQRAARGSTFAGAARSEWIKLWSLRSTFWCLLIVVVLIVGLGALVSATLGTAGTPGGDVQPAWVLVTTVGVSAAQLVTAVLGALVITGEYGSGMIRTTFTATPRRSVALLAKAVVFGLVVFGVSLIALVATAVLTAALLAQDGASPALDDSAVWWAVLGAAAYLALVGIIALCIGTIVRSSAGAIAAALGLLLVAPAVLQIVAAVAQARLAADLGAFLPSGAGAQMYSYPPPSGAAVSDALILDPVQGLLVLLGWIVVLGGVALTLVRRRDV
jgi:ABC-2 type transport system permease protein